MQSCVLHAAFKPQSSAFRMGGDNPMTASTAVFAILFSLLLGAMIPGPSFVIVARNSIGISRADGLATALGMGVGGIFFGGIALAGLYTLLVAVEWLYIALKIAGGLYLIYIASKIWRGASKPMQMPT